MRNARAQPRTTEAQAWLRSAAHHEAGHACLTALVGGAVDRVVLDRAGDLRARGGHAATWPPGDRTPIGTLTGRIAILRAGELAAARGTPQRALARLGAGWDDSDIAAAIAASDLPAEVVQEVRAQAEALATVAVRLLWPAIEAVARQLLVAGHVDGERVHELVGRIRGEGLEDFGRTVRRLVA